MKKQPTPSPMRAIHHFTLIELLLVVSIIAILCSLLLPALNKARDSAKQITCSSQLRQIGQGSFGYNGDFDGWLPFDCRSWYQQHMVGQYLNSWLSQTATQPNSSNTELFHCPSDTVGLDNRIEMGNPNKTWAKITDTKWEYIPVSYGINAVVAGYPTNIWYPPHRNTQIKRPSLCCLYSEGQRAFDGNVSNLSFIFHPGKVTVSYADGHVTSVPMNTISSTTIPSTSAFWAGGDD